MKTNWKETKRDVNVFDVVARDLTLAIHEDIRSKILNLTLDNIFRPVGAATIPLLANMYIKIEGDLIADSIEIP